MKFPFAFLVALIASAISASSAYAGSGNCGSHFIAPTAASFNATSGDDGTRISSANATGAGVGWAAASLPVALPSPASVGVGWTLCGATDNNKALVLNAPLLSAPAAPTLGSTTGGSLSARTEYYKVTYVNLAGETVASTETSIAVGANTLVTVASPGAVGNALNYNVYASSSTGVETKQNSSPIALGTNWTEPVGGLVGGASPPSTGTASSAYILADNATLNTYVVGPGNYLEGRVESDGSNFRLSTSSPQSLQINGVGNFLPARRIFPSGPGYAASLGDNGNVLSSQITGSGLAVSLPDASTLTSGWMIGLTSAGTSLPVVATVTGGARIVYATATGGASVTTITVVGAEERVFLQFDGANFHIIDSSLQTALTLSGGLSSLSLTNLTVSGSCTVGGLSCGPQFSMTNDTSTGTITNRLASLTTAGRVITAPAGSVSGLVGIVVAGGGSSGSATVVNQGVVTCLFDGPTVAGDAVQLSPNVAGECNDAGNSLVGVVTSAPALGTATQMVGRVLSTNGGGGNYQVLLQMGPLSLGAVPSGPPIMGTAGMVPQIVYVGDSLTLGLDGTFPYNHYITLPTYNGIALNGTNVGISGWTLQQMYASAPIDVNPLFNSRAGLNVLVIWGGTNDISVSGQSPQQAFANLQAFAQRQRQLGWKVIVATMIARSGFNTQKTALDNLIRQNWTQFADGLSDVAANFNLGDDNATTNLTYYQPDGTHLTDTGYALVGSIMQTAIEKLVANANPQALVPTPNILLNASMEIDQLNEGAAIPIAVSGSPILLTDTYKAIASGTAATGITAQRVADGPPGFPNSLKITVGTGALVNLSDYLAVFQAVSGRDVAGLGYGSTNPSPTCRTDWIKSSVGGPFSEFLLREDLGRVFNQLTVSLTPNVWTKVTMCAPGDFTGGWTTGLASAIRVGFGIAAGAIARGAPTTAWEGVTAYGTVGQSTATLSTNGATFQWTAGKWEQSPVPTPFVRRAFTEELQLVQPYFQKSYNTGTVPGTVTATGADFLFGTYNAQPAGHSVRFAPKMVCVTPSVQLFSPSTGAVNKVQDSANSVDVTGNVYITSGNSSFGWYASPSAGNAVNLLAHWIASCRL